VAAPKPEVRAQPIAVLIPTLARPQSLTRALRSVFAQDRCDLIRVIVIADNAPDASARRTVEALRSCAPVPIVYVHAEPPGVATARNVGLAATDAPYVAFLDDDEEAGPNWLGELYETHRQTGADVTFGPVHGRATGAAAWKRPYLDRFFSRIGPARSGLIETVYGCGNSIMTRSSALLGIEPFDTDANHTGGEDDRLFCRLRAEGARFAWAAEAVVEEHAPSHRARLRYALGRAVSFGQSPTQICLRRGDVPGALKWIAIGACQAMIYGVAALCLMVTGRAAWLPMADRAARGFGKTLWFARFHFYGRGAVVSEISPKAGCAEETPAAEPARG
jgi:succinoglycan biosynthesis protein ExoM